MQADEENTATEGTEYTEGLATERTESTESIE
jgi:hypothetical protein